MISEKQKKILAFPYSEYDVIICDGAVRSGKTSVMMVAFIDWAMQNFSGQRFGICGKTVDSATKNIITPYVGMKYAKKRYSVRWRRSEKMLEVCRGPVKNYFEIFGGKDDSSFMLIQGRTLAGILLDEVALMPQSFVQQALARCSVDGARIWFSCNPDSPKHWFYTDWILRSEERNALYLRFSMEDNPSLSQKVLERYKKSFAGVFYDRYIRGLWVVAEGLIYPMFGDHCISKTEPRQYTRYLASMDYGIQNPTSIGIWGLCDGIWYRVKEYYHSGRETGRQKTDQEYYDDLEKLAGDLPVEKLIIDPSATSFIALVNQKHRFKVWKANNDVVDGIQHTASCLQDGTIKINDCCKNAVKEFGLYRWDEKAGDDKPIKENDHAMDEIRYFVNTTQIWRKKTPYQSIF